MSGSAHIAAQVAGDPASPPLLLLGGATWSRDWWPHGLCTRLIDAGLRVVRYDQRDTGASTTSPPGAPDYTSGDLAADAIAVLDAIGARRALVLGLSMGGGLAQWLASHEPARVAGLVLVSTTPADGVERDLPPPTSAVLATFEEPAVEPDWSDRDAVIECITEGERPYAGPERFDEAGVRRLAALTWERSASPASAGNHFLVAESAEGVDLAAIRAPVLVVHGSMDPLFPLPHGQALAKELHAPLLALDGVGHQMPPADTWPELVDGVVDLLARAGGERHG